ncbi:uncharacterized protein LOC124455594 [Xenia sp. Carnegie-2017]|uniref:uncharacterized protein LOC124455594 n=1 Tax=Xenia sp. Carnegie-2017 TaxID=2897299 RepID=UPI001F036C43|nr:uncharacterized protein LOC124455594 [Xenia sp. Carnegie-2017]
MKILVLRFIADELTRKYGHGRIIEKKCPQCDEYVELRTAGAHVGNSTAVYADDDRLVCPYCDYIEADVSNADEKLPSEANEESLPSQSENKSVPRKRIPRGKAKPSSMQVAFENAMKEHNKYLKESDEMFLSEMKKEAEKERELRKEELNVYKESMSLLANAIAMRSQPVQQPFYNVHHDAESQQTYYKL